MQEALISSLPQLGVGVVAIIALVLTMKRNADSMDKKDHAYKTYVEANNHKMTELVVASTESIRENTQQAKQISEQYPVITEVLKEVRDHFVKHH